VLYLAPSVGGDFRSFFCAAGSYGTVGVQDGQPFYSPQRGALEIREIKYVAKA
jgi:hypothetical protein